METLKVIKLKNVDPQLFPLIGRACPRLLSLSVVSCDGIRDLTNHEQLVGYRYLDKLLTARGADLVHLDLRYSVEMCDAVLLRLMDVMSWRRDRPLLQFLGSRLQGTAHNNRKVFQLETVILI